MRRIIGERILPTTWDTGKLSSLGSPARQSFRMTTQRNRRNTFGKNATFPQYESRQRVTPQARGCPERLKALLWSVDSSVQQVAGFEGRPTTSRCSGSSGPLLGAAKSESKRKRSSVSKGTREARLSRVAAWLNPPSGGSNYR